MFKRLTIILVLALLCNTALARNRGLTYHTVQVVDEVGKKVTTISSVEIYNAATTTNAVIYSDRALSNTITIPMTTGSANTTLSDGFFEWWGNDGYAYSITDGTNVTTNADHRTRTSSESIIVFPTYLTAISSSAYLDDQSITFGTSLDWVASAGTVADRMTWTPATDSTSAFWIGNTSFTADLNLWGATPGYDLMWDASRNQWSFRDSAVLGFGGAAASAAADFTVYHTAASGILTITAVAADETVEFGDGTIATDVRYQNTTTAGADVWWDDSLETWHFGVDNTGVDAKFWGDGTGNYIIWDESIDTLVCVDGNIKLDDDAIIYLGTGTNVTTADGDVTIQYDGTNFEIFATAVDTPLALGGTSFGFDFTYYFETAGQFRTDYDADFINLTDDMEIRFGTGASSDGDFKISSNSSDILQIEQVVLDTGTIEIGVDSRDIPIKWYAETASSYFQLTGDDVNIEAMNLALGDGDAILLGDALGTGDFKISATSAVLNIDGVVDGTGTIEIGNDDDDIPLKWFAETASSYFLFTGDTFQAVAADITLDATSELYDKLLAGTKVLSGIPVVIEFRPTTAETLTWTVPTGYTLVVTDCTGWKIAGAGSGAGDDLNLQNNDGSAANIFDTEELDSVADKARIDFDNLDDTENEVASTNTLDLVVQESSNSDCIIVVAGYLK